MDGPRVVSVKAGLTLLGERELPRSKPPTVQVHVIPSSQALLHRAPSAVEAPPPPYPAPPLPQQVPAHQVRHHGDYTVTLAAWFLRPSG